jgi:hypothetical protein
VSEGQGAEAAARAARRAALKTFSSHTQRTKLLDWIPGEWLDGWTRVTGLAIHRVGSSREYPYVMTLTVHLPGELASVLEAEAARRGQTPDRVAADLLAERLPAALTSDPVEAFIGSADSGDPDWAGRDTYHLRAEATARRPEQPA